MGTVTSNVHNVTRIEIASTKVERSNPADPPFYTITVRVFVKGEDMVSSVDHTLIGGEKAIPLSIVTE